LTSSRPEYPFWRAWWPAAVWIILITFESSDYFSSQNTGSMLYLLLSKIFGGQINFYDFLIFHHYLRKTGHCVGYGMLCILLLRGWRVTLHGGDVLRRAAIFAWLGTVFVATMDEWHQSFIPSRTGTWRDVVLDSTAGLVFVLIACFRLRRRERHRSVN
jgi:VanZ family protein